MSASDELPHLSEIPIVPAAFGHVQHVLDIHREPNPCHVIVLQPHPCRLKNRRFEVQDLPLLHGMSSGLQFRVGFS